MHLNDLTILVLHYRTSDLLKECLKRLVAFAPGARIVVLDSSPEKTLVPGLEVVHVPNLSFAHTLNCGLKLAHTPFVAHMNADVFVTAETFPALLGAIRRPRVGMVGPRARAEGGKFQDQGLPYRIHYARSRYQTSAAVPWLSGCLQLVRRDAALAVGGMDASLRFYNEDIEWCTRFRRQGLRCELVQTDVLHLGGSSTPKDPRFLVEGYRGGYRLSQRYRGTLYQAAHRTVVRLLSAWERRFARDTVRQEAAQQISEMFRRGQFNESPFGPTLDSSNPAFGLKIATEDIHPLADRA